MSGPELAARVTKAYPGIRIIYTSGYTDDSMLRDGVLESTTHFLSKPYTSEDLTRKVREVLDASVGSSAAELS